MTTSLPTVQLIKNRDKRFRNGSLWLFSNEIIPTEERPPAGALVRILNYDNRYLGTGFYHPNSLIAVRLLTSKDVPLDASFFRLRLNQAIRHRQFLLDRTNAVRLVHAESDGLPGLIVDRYASGLVLQIFSAGMEKHRDIIISLLRELLDPSFIILRNDHTMRNREGLSEVTEFVHGTDTDIPVVITENSLEYEIDPLHGQKTGFYIDQREHRMVFGQFIVKGDRVLDAFCHDGGFAMHAAKAGAASVTAIDNSNTVLQWAKNNFHRNGLGDLITIRKGELIKMLPQMAEKKETFDAINLDPPNFAANRKSVGPALRGYRKIHRAALAMLPPGGILATSSCSHHITEEAFLESVHRASRDIDKRVQLLYKGGNQADHPVLPEMPETGYLKFFIFRAVDIT